MCTGDKAAGG